MSAITIQDFLKCASHTLKYYDDIPPPGPHITITDGELMCKERMVPDYPLPEPAFPTAVKTSTRLLNFETVYTVPLCLKPPFMACRKRYREECGDACPNNEPNTPSQGRPRCNEEWLSWVNWESTE